MLRKILYILLSKELTVKNERDKLNLVNNYKFAYNIWRFSCD